MAESGRDKNKEVCIQKVLVGFNNNKKKWRPAKNIFFSYIIRNIGLNRTKIQPEAKDMASRGKSQC